MPSPNAAAAPFIKICGVRGGNDVATALAHGASAVGVMLTKSPRQITWEQARAVVEQVGDAALVAGVFHGESPDEVREATQVTGITAIQLHGLYAEEDFAALSDLNLPLIRAVSAAAPDLQTGAYGDSMLIVDAPKPGSGETWDYRRLKGQLTGRWLLAGGLTPENVHRALEESGAWGIDVSSGVEAKRVTKSPDKTAHCI